MNKKGSCLAKAILWRLLARVKQYNEMGYSETGSFQHTLIKCQYMYRRLDAADSKLQLSKKISPTELCTNRKIAGTVKLIKMLVKNTDKRKKNAMPLYFFGFRVYAPLNNKNKKSTAVGHNNFVPF